MGGRVEGQSFADLGARTPIGVSGNFRKEVPMQQNFFEKGVGGLTSEATPPPF